MLQRAAAPESPQSSPACSSFSPWLAAPFVGIVPNAATAPALILVGSMMLATITEIRWHEPLVAVPAFLTLVLIPLTYSIANGLGFGIIAWAVLHLAPATADARTGSFTSSPCLFALRFIYIGRANSHEDFALATAHSPVRPCDLPFLMNRMPSWMWHELCLQVSDMSRWAFALCALWLPAASAFPNSPRPHLCRPDRRW